MAEKVGARQLAPNRRSRLKGLGLTTALAGGAPAILKASPSGSASEVAMRRPGKSTGGLAAPTLPSAAVIAFGINGNVDWLVAFLVFLGSGTGAWLGAKFQDRIPEFVLSGVFAVVLLGSAVRMWL